MVHGYRNIKLVTLDRATHRMKTLLEYTATCNPQIGEEVHYRDGEWRVIDINHVIKTMFDGISEHNTLDFVEVVI